MEWSCQPTNENWLSITTPIQSLVHRKHNTTIVSKYMEFVLNSRQKLKRNHTLTLHLSRNKYRIEYLFVSAAATNFQYNCFALKFTFYVLWLKRNAHTHFVFSNNSKRTYMFCLSSAQKTGIRFGFFLVMPLTIAKSRMRFSSSLPRLPLPAGGKAWILMLMSFWCIFSGC